MNLLIKTIHLYLQLLLNQIKIFKEIVSNIFKLYYNWKKLLKYYCKLILKDTFVSKVLNNKFKVHPRKVFTD